MIKELVILGLIVISLLNMTVHAVKTIQRDTINIQTEELLRVPVCRSPYTGVRIKCNRSKTG